MPAREQTLQQLASAIGDKYEVLQWIGGGGMAEVYLARHRVHGGLAAVKVLAAHLAGDPAIVGRFLQEARTAASLSGQANIVTIFDVGENRGLYYLIMQYIEGEDLGAYLERKGRLPVTEAVQILSQVTQALVWAHAKGVVHRDLKPSNIRLDQNGRVIVLDFGIAKAGSAPNLTSAGERLGTPYYMAPEQIRGEACDGRTDLYALGLVFFELLTGRRAFTGKTHYEIEQGHLQTPAPAPEGVDPAVSGVVERLLEKDPEARYRSAEEVLRVLKGLEDGAPRVSGLAGPPLRPEASGARSRMWLMVGGVLVAGLVVVGLVMFAGRDRKAAPGPALAASVETATGVMVLVSGGEFVFGEAAQESPNPRRSAVLPDFYVDLTEVSNGTFRQFADATGRPMPEVVGEADHPVVNVTLAEARAFAEWAGKRLPTEEEWEKAARGPDGRVYPWGNTAPRPGQVNLGDGFNGASPVGALPEGASPYGARNMAGNVWEWTVTAYPVRQEEIVDMQRLLGPVGSTWNVIKGGSYAPQTTELWARSYMRRGFPETGKSPYIGFRCVKDAK